MSPSKPTNLAASVRQRLVNLSRQRGEGFQFILAFDGNELTRRVKATFRRRRSEIHKETPGRLRDSFERPNFTNDLLTEVLFGHINIVSGLQVHPEARALSKVPAQTQR
jgi:hypothetical protein